eukprot:IDg1343t1
MHSQKERHQPRAARTVRSDVARPYLIKRSGAEGRDCGTLIPQSLFDCRVTPAACRGCRLNPTASHARWQSRALLKRDIRAVAV